MDKNLGHDIVDRGVEAREEVLEVNGEVIRRIVPPTVDGTGSPAAAEDVGAD